MFVSVKVKALVDNTGAAVEVPGLLTPAGLLTPLLDYFLIEKVDLSLAWMRKAVRSVGLFLSYMQANPAELDAGVLFGNFARRLRTGTFEPQTGNDPTGLCWLPRTADDSSEIVYSLSEFFDWLAKENPKAALINPKIDANPQDLRLNRAAQRYRRDKALLGHIWSAQKDETKISRRIRGRNAPRPPSAEPPAFPDDRFMDLITDGFKVGNRPDHRGALIALLMHGAGFRASEPFHLYIEDVVADPGQGGAALVRIHHPSAGGAPPSWTNRNGLRLPVNRSR